MRVFVSVDMEGVAGVATLDQILRGGSGYPRAQELMTEEANAVVRGAFDAGASEVLVNDSHGTMDNLLHDRLDPRARLLFGHPRPQCMAAGVSAEDDVALFIGYHAAAGQPGVLAHTFSTNFTQLRIDGQPCSEADVNALLCAEVGVPVGLVSGDDRICAQWSGRAATVQTKVAYGFASAESHSPRAVREQLQARVADVVRQAGTLARPHPPGPQRLEVDMVSPLHADFAAATPRTQRLGAVTLCYDAETGDELVRAVMAWYYLASLASQQLAALALRR